MADGNSVHQQPDRKRGLETGVRPFDPPLLPFEVALIETLGCTEQEYREFIRHAQLRARVRPAEYEDIPDVENAVAVAIVSLVIGLASTAVSILLAPKVPTLDTSTQRIRNRQLSDQIGPTRFNQTTSFDNVSSLAEYNQPIPIPFGKRDIGADGLSTGGIIIAPALVWSRLFANGSFQSYEGIYVAGQFGLTTPELGGIRVGTTALSILDDNEYALYWSSKAGSNRPTSIIAGSSSATLGRQVFTSPTADGQFSSGFSFAYNPQNQSQFGTFSPIQNGTAFRFNWEIVSAPEASTLGSENQEQRFEIKARRRKIAGAKADVLTLFDDQTAESIAAVGQPGVGRQYSKRMGITRINGQPYSVRTFVNVTVGATAVFTINPENWDAFAASDFKDTEVNLTDLESSADAWRTRADDILTVGSRWIIGGTVWVVESRTGSIPSSQVNVNLRCTEVIGTGQIGAAGTRAITEALAGYDGRDFDPNTNIGTGFYPLCRYSEAAIRPVRRDTEVIEIGIKSQVWNRASGLTNFNALVTPAKLLRLDQKNIAITTPRLDRYFARSSFFSILVRPVQKFGQGERAWVRIPIFFCVTGSAPIDQFNLIRIRPRVTDYYEYRIVPSPGAQVNPPTSDDTSQSAVQSQLVIQLDAEGILGDTNFGQDYSTAYGAFRISTKGKLVSVGELTKNKELTTNASTAFTGGTPTTPGTTTTTNTPTAVTFLGGPVGTTSFKFPDNAVYFELFGDPRASVVGAIKVATFTVSQATRSITIRTTATLVNGVVGTDLSADYVTLIGSTRAWRNQTYSVQSFTGDWPLNSTFDFTRALSSGNVFKTSSVSTVTFNFRVSNVSTTTSTGSPTPNTPTSPDGVSRAERIFEQQSQLADVSFYQELTKSNESGPEHEIVYINEYIANQTPASYTDLSTLAIAVKSSGQIGSVGQIRAWLPSGINVPRLIDGGTGPSNLFADLLYYLLLDQSQGVGNIVPEELIDTQSLQITARFLRANKIFYDGVIEDSEALRSFIFNLAPLQLCNFTIKNGRFGLIPALPYDSNFNISTRPVPVEQIFTSGNIIEDSLQLQYIDIAQRTNFRALVTWRQTVENDLPTQASVIVDWADVVSNDRPPTQQVFDLTDFCTNREQALRTARFLLSIRRRVTQTVTFKTVPDALGIQPGSYIRVMTTATTFNANTNGVITDAGSLVTINPLPNGTYNAMVYNPTTQETFERSLTISNNTVSDPALRGTLFTLMSQQNNSSIYQVEQLTLDEDGLINVSAIQVPVDSSGASIVAKDVLTPGNFTYTE